MALRNQPTDIPVSTATDVSAMIAQIIAVAPQCGAKLQEIMSRVQGGGTLTDADQKLLLAMKAGDFSSCSVQSDTSGDWMGLPIWAWVILAVIVGYLLYRMSDD